MQAAAPAPLRGNITPLVEIFQFSLNQICAYPEHCQFATAAVIKDLKVQFGTTLVQRVLDARGNLNLEISVEEVKRLLVEIAAEVRKEDLEELFRQIIKGEPLSACLNGLTPEQRDGIARCNHFDQLNDAHLSCLLGLFRNVTTQKGESQPVGSLFPIYETHGKTSPFDLSLRFIRGCESVETYVQTDPMHPLHAHKKKVAGYEHMARDMAYKFSGEKSKGKIVPILGEDGEVRLFTVRGAVAKPGLYFYTMLPLTESQWKIDANFTCPIYCCFRGTADMDAWRRNLTELTFEAGEHSYAFYEPDILKCLCATLREIQPGTVKYKLCGGGHSLAAADIMRLVVTIFANGDHSDATIREALHRIVQMQIATFNPACLVERTINRFLASKHKLPVVMDPPYHNYVDEDIVTLAGLYLLGYQPETPSTLPAYIAKFTFLDHQQSVATTNFTHRTPILNNKRAVDMVLINNPEEANCKLRPRGVMKTFLSGIKGITKNLSNSPIATRNLMMWCLQSYLTGRPVSKPEELNQLEPVSFGSELVPLEQINEDAVMSMSAGEPLRLSLAEEAEMQKIKAELAKFLRELGFGEDWVIL